MMRILPSFMVAALVLHGCAGRDGKDATTPGPSISGLSPNAAFLARHARLSLSGSGTTWSAAAPPTVSVRTPGAASADPSVTVTGVVVASPTSLIVEMDVAAAAAPGSRSIAVDELLLESALLLQPPIAITLFGDQAQGSVLQGVATLLDPSAPFTGVPSAALSPGASLRVLAHDSGHVEFEMYLDATAAITTAASLTFHSGALGDVPYPSPGSFRIDPRAATPLWADLTLEFEDAHGSALLSVTNTSGVAALEQIAGAFGEVRFFALDAGGSFAGALEGVTSVHLATPPAFLFGPNVPVPALTAAPARVVAVNDLGVPNGLAGVDRYEFPAREVEEVEDNDNYPAAQVLAMPVGPGTVIVHGSADGTPDYFRWVDDVSGDILIRAFGPALTLSLEDCTTGPLCTVVNEVPVALPLLVADGTAALDHGVGLQFSGEGSEYWLVIEVSGL